MLDHWAAGLEDAGASLTHRDWIRRHLPKHGMAVFDLGIDRVTYTGADGTKEIFGAGEEDDDRIGGRVTVAKR
jgi:hypothetical protein